MRTIAIACTIGLLIVACITHAAEPTTAPASQPATQPKIDLERFSFVILRAGDNPPKLSNEESAELQKKHLAHLRAMFDAGRLVVAGPIGDQPDKTMRGFCIYRLPL